MIHVRLLGSLELTESDGTSVLSVLSQPKRLGLLAFLLTAHPRDFHSRDKLLALFWPEADEERARNALRQALYFLRRSLGEESVIGRGEDVAADATRFSCDVLAFDEAIHRREWESAVELYRGPLLEGFHVSGAPEFDHWLEGERERLRLAATGAWEELVGEREAKGDLPGAVEAARRWVQLTPASGRPAQKLIHLLARTGDRAGALREYERFRTRAWEDFGLEPTAELRTMVEEIRRGTGAVPAQVEADGQGTSTVSISGENPNPASGSPPATPGRHAARPRTPERRKPSGRGLTGPKAPWTIIAFVAMIALGYGLYFLSNVDRRTPVRLTGFQDLRPDRGRAALPVETLQEIADVMEGSTAVRPVSDASDFRFLQSGTVLRDTLRLILDDLDPETGSVLERAYPFREPLSESDRRSLAILVVRDIERAIAGRSEITLTMRGTSNLAASQAYFAGRALWALRDPDQFSGAIRSLEAAVAADSGYALAYAALADVYNLLGAYDYGLLPPESAHRLAGQAARRANSLDTELAEAHAALATTQFFYEWDYDGAEMLYRSALRLDPGYSHAHQWLSLLLAAQKRFDEALDQVQEALRVDSSEVILTARARIHYFERNFREALRWYDMALEGGTNFIPAHLGKGLTALMAGEFEAALAAYEEAERYLGGPVPITLAVKGHLLGKTGDSVGAREILGRLERTRSEQDFVPPEYLAMVHLGLEEHERAMDYLDEAYDNRSNVMNILEVEPLLVDLQNNERFQRLRSRVLADRIR